MKKKEAMDIARDAKTELKKCQFNNLSHEIGYDLYSFQMDSIEYNVFAYIGKQQDEDGKKWYSVYAGVEFEGGDTIYADYDNSTNHLQISELANTIYQLANRYQKEENINTLRKMLEEK